MTEKGFALIVTPWPAGAKWRTHERNAENLPESWMRRLLCMLGAGMSERSLQNSAYIYLPRYARAKGQRTESQLEVLRHIEVFGGKESPRCLQEVPTKQRALST